MTDNAQTNFSEREEQVECYSFTEAFTSPLFANLPRSQTQPAPAGWFQSTHPFVLDWYREGDGWLAQCVFNLLPSLQNNHYAVFLYDWKGRRLYRFIVSSHTVYPPVWDRGFGLGPDYTDYVSIQRTVKRLMEREGLAGFEVDEALEGKWVYMTRETPNEVRVLLAEGKSYSIVALKAEAAMEKLTLKSVTPATT